MKLLGSGLVFFLWGLTAVSAVGLVKSVVDNNLAGVVFCVCMVALWGYLARNFNNR